MVYESKVYQVMIASPRDVVQERHLAVEVIYEWNAVNSHTSKIVLIPAGWETHSAPLMGDRPQEIINRQVLENSDLLVGIFWTRIGTPTGKSMSGTAEEIEKHIEAGKPAMLYFSDAPIRPDSVDDDQYKKLQEFKRICRDQGLLESYESPAEFRRKFSRQLSIIINQHDYFGLRTLTNSSQETVNNSYESVIVRISEDAQILLREASQDRTGTIMRLNTMQGLIIQTNGRQFTEPENPRSEAQWEAAVQELYSNGFIQDRGYKGEIFTVTSAGYELADRSREGK